MPHKDPDKRATYHREHQARWRAANRERARELGRESYHRRRDVILAKNPALRARRRLKRFGVTPEGLQTMLADQGFRCLCEKPLDEHTCRVDHCHATGRVRGLLCNECNVTLGFVRENPETLRRLAAYLEDK